MSKFSADFSKRLSFYGIDRVGHDEIHITSPITWDDNNNLPFHVTTIKTGNLDELKHYLGVQDDDVANDEPPHLHKHLASLSSLPDEHIHEAASAYVFGNSALLKQHKTAIESKLGVRQIQVLATNTLIVDSILTIDGTKSIVADTIIFKAGGQIKNVGVLSINAKQIIRQA